MRSSNKKSGNTTIVDIAREVGVSHATVSRVLNNRPGVKESTRQEILAAVQRLGYTVNQQARRLAGGRSHVIGLIISGLTHGYSNTVLAGIEDEISQTDYDLLLYSSHSRQRRQQFEDSYVDRLTNGLSDGLLILSPFFSLGYLDTLEKKGFPYVLVDYYEPSHQSPIIHATNWQGAYDATEYLIQLGHQRIGFITGWDPHPSSGERLAGYKAALEAHQISFQHELIAGGDFLQSGGYKAAQKLLTLPAPPTAIFATSDDMAIGTLEAARERGMQVPADLSIIGFDDIPQASLVYPKLTTVSQSLPEIGRTAVRTLMRYIETPDCPRQQLEIQTRLIIRDSCQPPLGRHSLNGAQRVDRLT
ncbi:MAG: LacI family transcriptional regulator [Anaerolineae bacterium]|nr:LacI family transcriptional regulator [Anaerolineae bacterium]